MPARVSDRDEEAVPEGLRVQIRDHGCAFDPQAVPEPCLAEQLCGRTAHGWGLYLIRRLVDEVEITSSRRRGNTVNLLLRAAPAAEPAGAHHSRETR